MKRQMNTVAVAAIVSALTVGALQSLLTAFADQSERVPPTSGIFTGIQYSQKIGDAMRSISTGNKGSSAPANVGGTTVDGLGWLDDTTSTWIDKLYVNGNWAIRGAYVAADSSYVGVIGGGAPVSLESASTVNLGSVPQANVTITGTTGITGFGSAAPAGVIKFIRFDNALTLTHSANLLVPGGYNLTTAATDRAIVTHLGSGAWEITQYTRASGIPVDVSAVGRYEMNNQASTPGLSLPGDGRAIVRASYPAYTAKMTRVQNGTRTSGNATITGIADTSRMGLGHPVESTGVNAGCTIASIVANTSITLNSAGCVTASGTSPVTVILTGYGSGGSASTIGVPNCGGAVLAGRETTATRLSSTYFGGNSTSMAVFGGSDNHTLSSFEMPSHSHANTLTDPGHQHLYNAPIAGSQKPNSAGSSPYDSESSNSRNVALSGTGITINNVSTGGGAPHSIIQPTLIAQCDVRVIP